jgi:hypothetical protein
MINTIVWCLITVTLSGAKVDTAAQGKVIKETKENYFVDFSLYARQQRYEGSYYYYKVYKNECFEKGEK